MTISTYKRAKSVFILRRRFLPWLRHQMPGFVVALVVALGLMGAFMPRYIQWAMDKTYTNCVSTATHFSCEVRNAN